MLKTFLISFSKIIDLKLMAVSVVCYLILCTVPIAVINDFFALSSITGRKDFIFKLLTTTIGFSGLILTVLLVVYNLYLKVLRRNTFEFIIDNKWLRLIFTSFFTTVSILTISFCLVDSNIKVNSLTIIYISLSVSIILILSLFPLAILSLKDSNSIVRIRRIILTIKSKDIEDIVGNRLSEDLVEIDDLEKNPILIIKDICLTAIKERDWALPQTILKELYQLLFDNSNNDFTELLPDSKLNIWLFFCNKIKHDVIESNDIIIARLLLAYNFDLHSKLVIKSNGGFVYKKSLDDLIEDFCRMMIEKKAFFELHGNLLRQITNVIIHHIHSISFSDEQLPTSVYCMKTSYKYLPTSDRISLYWHYTCKYLPNVLINTIKIAIKNGSKEVYDNFNWNTDSIMTHIVEAKNLTDCQKEELFTEYMQCCWGVSEYAISYGIYSDFEAILPNSVFVFYQTNWSRSYEVLYYYSYLFDRLSEINKLFGEAISNFFSMARAISNLNIEKRSKHEVISTVIEHSIKVLNNPDVLKTTKREIKYQLYWLKDKFLDKNPEHLELLENYGEQLKNLLGDFDYHDRYS